MLTGRRLQSSLSWVGLGLALTAVALVAGGCGRHAASSANRSESLRLPVETATVRTGALEVAVDFSGRVVPRSEVRVASKASGRVEQVLVDVGDRVAAGQLLVRLEAGSAEARLREAEAALATARANRERLSELYREGAVARQALDQAELEEERARVAVDLAREGVEAARVLAPVAGEVSARFVNPGDLAAPGGPLLTLIDPGRLYVEASLSETQVASIRPGQRASVEVAGRTLAGVVERVGPGQEGQGRSFPVRVALQDAAGIRPGMTARARVRLQGRDRAVVAPRAALVEGAQGVGVYVVQGGRARWRPVRVGLDDGQRVEVLAGLAPGEQVIVAGQAYVQDGTPVEARPAAGEKP